MISYVESKVRSIKDFPKEGIIFRDITSVIKDAKALQYSVDYLYEAFKYKKIDYVVGVESRGFIFGTALAYKLGAGMILVRKPGKLPCETISQEYELEYGTDKIEIHKNDIEVGKNVVVIDDLLATGGTVEAVCKLMDRVGAEIKGVGFIMELKDLNGRAKMPKNVDVVSMLSY